MSGSGLAPYFAASGTLGASGSTPWFALSEPFNIMLSGAWVGSVALEATPDGGTTAVNCVLPDGTPSAFTANGLLTAPHVWERALQFRLTFTRTSGTLGWRISR